MLFSAGVLLVLGLLASVQRAFSQDTVKDEKRDAAILWEPVDIPSRNLFHGPTSDGIRPNLKGMTFIGRQSGGNNLKYRVKDGSGREWVVKIADESRPEVAAVRLMWAIGYHTEIDQLVPQINIEKIGRYSNARFEARPESVKRGERWSWTTNPFIGTPEFNGLKLMMALIDNWDLKDDNNVILTEGGKSYYVVSDLGATFGSLAKRPQSRSGRSVGKVEGFTKTGFIKGTHDGILDLAYNGMADHLMKDISVEHARWLADLLIQLTDAQIKDAFRAANFSDEDADDYAWVVRERIKELDRVTRATEEAVKK